MLLSGKCFAARGSIVGWPNRECFHDEIELIENELHLHTVRNAYQKMARCMECMLKDGMLYGMHAERQNAV